MIRAGLKRVQLNPHTDWVLILRGVRIRVRSVLPSLFPAPPTTKRKTQSNPPKLTTHSTQSHPSTQIKKQVKKLPNRERKLLFAYFMAVLVSWMSFASSIRDLRGGVLSMLETHIVMSYLIFRLILTLVLYLALLHRLFLSSLIDLTIAHMVLAHEATALSLDALVTAHVPIVVIVSHVGLVFLLEGPTPTLRQHLDGPHFSHRGSHPTRPSGEVQRTMKTSSSRMVKCWIPKIYLTNPSIEISTFSRPI
jgi:hypothetical protein